MTSEWKPLGVFTESMPATHEGTNLWQHVGEWRQTGQIRLPHPQYPPQLDLLQTYTLELTDRTITFASGEVSAGAYAFYVLD